VLAGHDGTIEARIFDRHALVVGAEIAAPAVVEQADTTTLIEPGWRGRVSADGTLLVNRA
jgi:N-methylhydantoinase A